MYIITYLKYFLYYKMEWNLALKYFLYYKMEWNLALYFVLFIFAPWFSFVNLLFLHDI